MRFARSFRHALIRRCSVRRCAIVICCSGNSACIRRSKTLPVACCSASSHCGHVASKESCRVLHQRASRALMGCVGRTAPFFQSVGRLARKLVTSVAPTVVAVPVSASDASSCCNARICESSSTGSRFRNCSRNRCFAHEATALFAMTRSYGVCGE